MGKEVQLSPQEANLAQRAKISPEAYVLAKTVYIDWFVCAPNGEITPRILRRVANVTVEAAKALKEDPRYSVRERRRLGTALFSKAKLLELEAADLAAQNQKIKP